MNMLSKGNIFSQIKQYFSKGNPPAPEEEKEHAKVETEESTLRFGKEDEGKSLSTQDIRRRSTPS
jgi:hypothetical protein